MTTGCGAEGKCPALDDQSYVQAWRGFVEGREDAAHVVMFDCSSVHRPPPDYSPPKQPSVANSRMQIQDTSVLKEEPAVPETKPEDLRDIPPLSEQEYLDHDDEADAAKLNEYHKESNHWLFYLGIFALLNTVFLTRMTNLTTPQQQAAIQQVNMMIHDLQNTLAQRAAAEMNATYVPRPPPAPVSCTQEIWVPALWYASLMITVITTFIVLVVKNWLMGCSGVLYRFEPDDEEVDAKAAAAHAAGQGEPEYLRRARRRMVQYQRARKDALAKAEIVRRGVPVLLYSAWGMFFAGVVGKLFGLILKAVT